MSCRQQTVVHRIFQFQPTKQYANIITVSVRYASLPSTWWRHRMETFSALLARCAGNSPITGEFPSERPVMRSFDVLFSLRLNKRLSKQSRRRWFETHGFHYDVIVMFPQTAKSQVTILTPPHRLGRSDFSQRPSGSLSKMADSLCARQIGVIV